MQFETFRGRTVEEAIAAIKAAYGPDALIGSTRRVTNGRTGGLANSFFEVTAAPPVRVGMRPQLFSRDAMRTSMPNADPEGVRGRIPNKAARNDVGKEPTPMWTPAETDPSIRFQLGAIRALLEELSAVHRPKDRAAAMLRAARIEGALATKLAAGASKAAVAGLADLRLWLRTRIEERLQILPSPIAQPGPRLVVCVGPTGVGKTTTIAKLAARAHMDLGRKVSVVTFDTYRVGSIEQMRRFAELIGIPFDVVQDRVSFSNAIAHRRSEVTFVDTASLPASDPAATRRLAECIASVNGWAVDVLLAIPGSIHPRDAERLATAYRAPSPTGIVITKIDEAEQIGGTLHATLPHRIPLAYLCDGPRVPEDLHDADTESVLDAVLPIGQ